MLSVVPPASTPSNQSLPLEMPASVGVTQMYSHQALEQSQGAGGVASRMDVVETKAASLNGPPGELMSTAECLLVIGI